MGSTAVLDLTGLPKERAEKVREVYDRERAAVRIRQVYPLKLHRWKEAEAFRRTATQLQGEGFAFVTARWARSVIREGR